MEELLAKVLQSLRQKGYIGASRGAYGGYFLTAELTHISFLEFIQLFEDQVAVVDCANGSDDCLQHSICGLRSPLVTLNFHLTNWLDSLTLEDVLLTHLKTNTALGELVPRPS